MVKDIIDISILLDISAIDVWGDKYKYRNRMSETEKVIFDDMLPNRQMWYLVAGKKASDKAKNLYPNTINNPCVIHNGKGDSFRHTYWNALSTKLIGADLTNQLTSAHEVKPLEYSLQQKEIDMDLHNNNVGRNIGSYSTFNSLLNNVLYSFNQGQLYYLSNLDSDVNCRAKSISNLTPTNQ